MGKKKQKDKNHSLENSNPLAKENLKVQGQEIMNNSGATGVLARKLLGKTRASTEHTEELIL